MRINYSFWLAAVVASLLTGGAAIPILLLLIVACAWFEDYTNRHDAYNARVWAIGRLYSLHKKGVK